MTEYIHELYQPELMPDEQIQEILNEYCRSTTICIEKMQLNWNRTTSEYVLEIVLDMKIEGAWGNHESIQKHIEIGSVSTKECGTLNTLIAAGRKLYFRLKKVFPLLECKLSMYKYFRMHNL